MGLLQGNGDGETGEEEDESLKKEKISSFFFKFYVLWKINIKYILQKLCFCCEASSFPHRSRTMLSSALYCGAPSTQSDAF